jgi:hypothetical protein
VSVEAGIDAKIARHRVVCGFEEIFTKLEDADGRGNDSKYSSSYSSADRYN